MLLHSCSFVGIVFDELYIREDLVFDKHSSKVIGFVNLGTIDRQLSALEVDRLQSACPVATRILTLMVRGIFSEINFPLANFPTAGIRSTTKSMGTSTRLLTCTVQRRSGCTFFPTCHT